MSPPGPRADGPGRQVGDRPADAGRVSVAPIEAPGGPAASGVTAAIARVRQITSQLAPPPPTPPGGGAGDFASTLAGARNSGSAVSAVGTQTAMALPSLSTTPPAWVYGATTGTAQVGQVAIGPGTPVGQRLASLAAAELGVAEEPAGSNDGMRIAQYRAATAGSGVGPWCSYFTSWVAAQAGVPVGHQGQGLGWVPDVASWGKETGRFVPATGGAPAVGDLVIFDRNGDGVDDHIGVVTNLRPDGGFETVEGNSSDRVSQRSYGAGQAVGFVRLG